MSIKSLFVVGADLVIGTHDGEFHADDVFALAALAVFAFLTGAKFRIVRSRDPEVLADCDVLVDVGGIFDTETCRFDHHMREGAPVSRSNGVQYSSFGLVWREIGEILAGSARAAAIVDRDLVQGVDALDNGQGNTNVFSDSATEYAEHATISSVIGSFNPTWQEIESNLASYDSGCYEARLVAQKLLHRAIVAARAEAAAIDLLKPSGVEGVSVLEREGIDGAAIALALADSDEQAKFVVFLAGNGEWSAQAVPPSRKHKFQQRVRFPSAWDWKRGEALAEVSGVEGAIFSHGYGFFACAAKCSGAIALCEKAIEAAK